MTSQDLSGFIGPPSSSTAGADPFSDLYNTTANKLNERIKQGAQGQGFLKVLLRMLLGRMAGGDSNESEIKDLSYLFSHLSSVKQARDTLQQEYKMRKEQMNEENKWKEKLVTLEAKLQSQQLDKKIAADKEMTQFKGAVDLAQTGARTSQEDRALDVRKNIEEKKMQVDQSEGAANRQTQKDIAGMKTEASASKVPPAIEAKQMDAQSIASAEVPSFTNAFLGTDPANPQKGAFNQGQGPVARLAQIFTSPEYAQAYTQEAGANELADPVKALGKAGIDPEKEMKEYLLSTRLAGANPPENLFDTPVEQGKQRIDALMQQKLAQDPTYAKDAKFALLLKGAASQYQKGIGQLQEVYRAAYNNVRLQASKTDTIKNQLEEDFRNLAPATTVERSPGSVGNDPKVRKWRQEFAIPEDETVFNPTQAEAILKKFRDTVQKDPTYGMRFQKYLQTKK